MNNITPIVVAKPKDMRPPDQDHGSVEFPGWTRVGHNSYWLDHVVVYSDVKSEPVK